MGRGIFDNKGMHCLHLVVEKHGNSSSTRDWLRVAPVYHRMWRWTCTFRWSPSQWHTEAWIPTACEPGGDFLCHRYTIIMCQKPRTICYCYCVNALFVTETETLFLSLRISLYDFHNMHSENRYCFFTIVYPIHRHRQTNNITKIRLINKHSDNNNQQKWCYFWKCSITP